MTIPNIIMVLGIVIESLTFFDSSANVAIYTENATAVDENLGEDEED